MNILHSHTKSTLILHPDCRFIAEIEAGTPDFWELQSLTLGEFSGDSRIMIFRADWEGFKALVAEIDLLWTANNSGVDSMTGIPDFKIRVIEERKSLDEKRVKLAVFMDGDLFKSLPSDEQDRLRRQLDVMDAYSQILCERISEF